MADKQLTLIVRAKNAVATGFASVNNSVAGFRKNMMQSLAGVTGTVAATVAAYMLLKKALEGVIEYARRAGNEIRAAVAGNAEARVRSLAQSFELLGAWFSRATKRADAYADAAEKTAKATQAVEDAVRQAARDKAALSAAGAGGSVEDLAAMDKAAALEDKRIAAARKVAEIERQIKTSKAESAARAQQLTDEAETQADAIREAKKQEQIAARLAEQRTKMMSGVFYSKSEADKLKENEDIARKAAEAQRKAAEESVKRQNQLADENVAAEKQRTAQIIALAAAQTEAKNVGVRQAAEEAARRNSEQAKEQERLLNEEAALKERLADDADNRNEQAFRAELERNQKLLALEKHVAAVKIKDFLANKKQNEKAQERDAKQAARDDARALRLRLRARHGGNIGKANQEWLNAFNAVRGAQAGVANAQKNLDDLKAKRDAENTKKIVDALAANTIEMKKVLNELAMG